ncbi:MAG TPA: histidine kinase [Sphingomicrobium sp.]|nr:histidine kinase [Sphingomicrobium sp.]
MIALGRLLLAALFLVAILIDINQPAKAPVATYALLLGYVVFAATIVAVTWKNWWLDARLAGPAHGVDIVLFTVVVFVTEGYTSPYFIFFIFLLLAPAIRWGWRETALTAILVTLLYLVVGLVTATSHEQFELYRFVIRTSQLVIVSLILIWFGVNGWRPDLSVGGELLSEPSLDKSPLETGLRAAMLGIGAARGAIVWRERGQSEAKAYTIENGVLTESELKKVALTAAQTGPFLYDLPRNRALARDAQRNLRALSPRDAIPRDTRVKLALSEGLTVALHVDTGEGQIFLEEVRDLSLDHIDLGQQLGVNVAAHIQRHSLLRAVEESAEARSRLNLARDLHDSVVQFLAGAAFRLEAMKRSALSGRALGPELNELKELVLEEQGELRSFITAMRGGSEIALRDLIRDLQALADRLSRHWNVECDLSATPADMMIPTQLHLDAHQLMREAVANAVRHAGAKSIRIACAAARNTLRLDFVNDGADFPSFGDRLEPPESLKERVEQAGGALELSRGMDVTKLSISLPIAAGGRA